MYVDTYTGFMGIPFLCLIGCFSMSIWTPTVLSVLYACVLHFCIFTCSARLSMFHMERRSFRSRRISVVWVTDCRKEKWRPFTETKQRLFR